MPVSSRDALCEKLAWDTDFWGFRVARVIGDMLTPERVHEIDRWCQDKHITCLYFLARADDDATIRAAESAGYHRVDTRVTLDWQPGPIRPTRPSRTAIRPHCRDDVDVLARISGESHHDTRFWNDPGFPRAGCRALYESWIRNSCHGWAQIVLVAESGGQPAGYVTCHLTTARAGPVGSIGLIAVDESARGVGLGEALVSAAQGWLAGHGATYVTVVTQGANQAALALYRRRGFQVESTCLWYHRWFPAIPAGSSATGESEVEG